MDLIGTMRLIELDMAVSELEPNREIGLLEGKLGQVLFRPGGGFGIERALQVVALVTVHLRDSHHHLRQ